MPCQLNDYTNKTKFFMHLMITPLCIRNCKNCCNNQYSLKDIPIATESELSNISELYLTGGEPFLFTDPCEIAKYYREHYFNINRIIVYTNAKELYDYSKNHNIHDIDGVTVSLKTDADYNAFVQINKNKQIKDLPLNRLYDFRGYIFNREDWFPNWDIKPREWQEHFKPNENSFFRKIM